MRFVSKITALALLAFSACRGQNSTEKMENNPLLCDPVQAVCAFPGAKNAVAAPAPNVAPRQKSIKIVYFTDPICSSCWGIEPQLRRLKLEWGDAVEIEYRMGGLLPKWEGFNGGGISKPSDVAGHWDEVSHHYEMPIDGDIWLEDPLTSSFPPSVAFKAAERQDPKKAVLFLRRIREMVFLEKKNICRWEHLEAAAEAVGLDAKKLKTDFDGAARTDFQEDLALARSLGVRGFPTLFFSDSTGQRLVLYGSKPYVFFEKNVQMLAPEAEKAAFDASPDSLFSHFSSLTAKEFSVLAGKTKSEAERLLDGLFEKGKLEKAETKNGAIWRLKK